MKRCPTCQRTYPDNAPDQCPYDGTMVMSDTQQPQYIPGGQPPYAAPGAPPQWQQQQAGYYQQPAQYAPGYGGPYAPTGSRALSNAAFFCGLGAFIIMVLLIVFYVMVSNGALDLSTALTIAQILQPLSYVMLIAGGASIVLGIVALVMSGKNPALSKAKAIIGMVLGVIPLVLFLIGIANRGY
ncbi:MAG TPA: hypothetical protein VKB86_18820 [Pyrinomonadaceae bacterium]|nr:hypothetical protein [Pyrinomonadaceae bacterium]